MSISITIDDIKTCLLHDTILITTVTNYGYILYTLNMLKSLRQFNLDKYVFIVAMDEKSESILKKLGYTVYCVNERSLGKFCPWNTKGYDRICYYKLELLYRILSLQKNVLLVEIIYLCVKHVI